MRQNRCNVIKLNTFPTFYTNDKKKMRQAIAARNAFCLPFSIVMNYSCKCSFLIFPMILSNICTHYNMRRGSRWG